MLNGVRLVDHYCICVAAVVVATAAAADWCRIAVVVDDFRFMRWNHASLGRPGTGRRHYRNRSRVVVSRVVMAVMIVLLVVMLLMLVTTAVAATAAVR